MRPDLLHTAISAEPYATGLRTGFRPLAVRDPLSVLHGRNIANAWVACIRLPVTAHS